jgi:DNA polymerase-3 subunit epsilon
MPLHHSSTIKDIDEIAVFDAETTGIDRELDRIVTFFIGVMAKDGTLTRSYSWLVNPGIPIPEGASAVHGITDEVAQAQGVSPVIAIREMASIMGSLIHMPIVAFNASYDLTILDRECRRHLGESFAEDLAEFIVIDPFIIDKGSDKYRKGKRTLTAVSEHFGVDLVGAHDAEADATATGRVAHAVLATLDQNMRLEDLHELQVTWAIEQAASLTAYFTRLGTLTSPIPGSWPMHPFSDAQEESRTAAALAADAADNKI